MSIKIIRTKITNINEDDQSKQTDTLILKYTPSKVSNNKLYNLYLITKRKHIFYIIVWGRYIVHYWIRKLIIYSQDKYYNLMAVGGYITLI